MMQYDRPPMNSDHLIHPKYRPDIDGLRAVAVLSVVFFHAFPDWIKGGFIGVDVFFVISGFLISTIILENLERNTFSFSEFYNRRIKRIFPSLLLVLVFSYGIGWLVLDAEEFQQLGKHILGGAGFVSNFVLWNESGYFDKSADTKPLLHLWSLGIEEQFYIFWPLILWLAWKMRVNLLSMIIIIGLASLGLNVLQVESKPIAVFYSPLTRIWELLAGALLAHLSLHAAGRGEKSVVGRQVDNREHAASHFRDLQSILGVVLIVAGILVISKKSAFPGWWALMPTAGAVLIISAGKLAWFNRVVLSNRILVWFGLISFPLYLWHWPLLSFARIMENGPPSLETRWVAVSCSVVLAWLSFVLVEKPVRFGNYPRTASVTLIILMLAVAGVGYNTLERAGLPFRAKVKFFSDKNSGNEGGDKGMSVDSCGIDNAEERSIFQNCKRDLRAEPKFALLGDSKAASLYPGLVRTSTDRGRWLFIGGTSTSGAPVPVLSNAKIFERHQRHISIAVDAISRNENIRTVVLVTGTRNLFNMHNISELPASPNYDAALEGIGNTIAKLLQAGKKVVIVVDNPTLPDPKDCISRKTSSTLINKLFAKSINSTCSVDLKSHNELTGKYTRLLEALLKRFPTQVRIFDMTGHLCEVENGVCYSYKNGRALYSYGDHISDYAAGLIGKDLNDFLSVE